MHVLNHTLEMFITVATGLKLKKPDQESLAKLKIVCGEDGREVDSTEQLREHSAVGHKEILLLRDEREISEMALARDGDRMSALISELTTGNLEKNISVWAKNEQLSRYLQVSR